MKKAKYSIGLDVGSTTAKVAVIDGKKNLIYSKYERHNARVKELVSHYFDEINQLIGDTKVISALREAWAWQRQNSCRLSLFRK